MSLQGNFSLLQPLKAKTYKNFLVYRASPKSAILKIMSEVTRMFLAARSRCTHLLLDRKLIPFAIWTEEQ